MIRPLTEEEKTALLKRQRLGRLACIVGGSPYIVPINYVLEGTSIYSHSLPGTKIDGLRINPAACVQVDEIADDFHWASVMAIGDYEEITNAKEREAALDMLLVRLPHLTPVESFHRNQTAEPSTLVFRIRIRELRGVAES